MCYYYTSTVDFLTTWVWTAQVYLHVDSFHSKYCGTNLIYSWLNSFGYRTADMREPLASQGGLWAIQGFSTASRIGTQTPAFFKGQLCNECAFYMVLFLLFKPLTFHTKKL